MSESIVSIYLGLIFVENVRVIDVILDGIGDRIMPDSMVIFKICFFAFAHVLLLDLMLDLLSEGHFPPFH